MGYGQSLGFHSSFTGGRALGSTAVPLQQFHAREREAREACRGAWLRACTFSFEVVGRRSRDADGTWPKSLALLYINACINVSPIFFLLTTLECLETLALRSLLQL